jgi:quercetin dioxygenase-like cupin family protein
MKPLLCSLLFVFTFSQNAQAPEAVPLTKEPHHHLVLENDYVRVFRVSLPAHAATLLHQHDVPYLYISLGPADVVNAVQGQPEARIVMADGQVGYSPGHFAHIARTDAGSTFDNVTIELLRPQGKPRNLCEKVVDGPVLKCPTENKNWPADSPLRRLAKLGMIPRRMFETDEIEVSSYSVASAGTYNRQDSNSSRLLVAEVGPQVHVEVEEEAEHSLESGKSIWIEAGKDWSIVVPKENKPTRFLVIRFKDTAAAKP